MRHSPEASGGQGYRLEFAALVGEAGARLGRDGHGPDAHTRGSRAPPRGPEGPRSWSGPDARSHRAVARVRVGPPRMQDSVWEILSGRGDTEQLGAARASGPWRLGVRFTGETWGVRACVQVEKPERTATQAPRLPQQGFSDGPWKVLSDTGRGRRDTGTCAMLTHVQWEACRDSSPGCRVCLKYL